MKLFPLADPLAGEKLADVVPAPAPFVDDAARIARLNLFPGRHLTAEAMQREQAVRVWPVVCRGQAVTPGIIEGLEVAWQPSLTAPALQLSAGRALAASGTDVVLARTATVRLDDLRFFDPATQTVSAFLGQSEGPEPANFVAILVLQPGYVRDTDIPLVAQIADAGTDFSPCDRVPDDETFYRTTTTDAQRALLCRWPDAPAEGPLWRNQLAWAVFAAERAGVPLPWTALGVPLALIAFDVNRRPLWVDRFAVVREGGRPRRRRLIDQQGEPRLWQAQFEQFSAQLAELASLDPAAANFLTLPPVGVLPKVFVDVGKPADQPFTWRAFQRFFPASYRLQVAVAPLEQLDTLVAACRSLEPFQLDRPEAVSLLLPVSQPWFDPDLLTIEAPAPEFQVAINNFATVRGDKLATRLDLRNRASALNLATTGSPLNFPDPDPRQLENPETPVSAPPAPDQQSGTTRTGTTFDDVGYAVDAYEAIKVDAAASLKKFTAADQAEFGALLAEPTIPDTDKAELKAYIDKQTQVQADETAQLGALGLAAFIDYLARKADAADQLIDSGFLKVRTDVYRVGQLLANNAIGTQFVASPSLATILQRRTGMSDAASANLYASQLLANFAPSAVQAAGTAAAAPAPANPGVRGLVGVPLTSRVFNTGMSFDPSGGVLSRVVDAGTAAETNKASLDVVAVAVQANPNLTEAQKKAFLDLKQTADTLGSAAGQAGLKAIANIGDFASSYVENFNTLSQKQIRTIPLDRFQPPQAPQARQDLHAGRLEIFDRLARLDLSLADLTTDFVDSNPPADPAGPPLPPFRFTFQKLIMRRQLDVIETVDAASQSIVAADESKYFSSGVKYADMSIAALRAVEKRVQLYRDFIVRAQAALAAIQGFGAAVQAGLNQVDDELDEARHDVAVAEALLREEELRLAAINAHREQILREHVGFVVYHRPIALSIRQDAPVRVVEPALRSDPIVDCLNEDLDLPPDLAALREAFRGSPARWFKYARGWLGTIDRLDHIRGLFDRVALRLDTTLAVAELAPAVSSGRYTAALTSVFTARRQVAQKSLGAVAAIDFARLPSLSWSDLQREATQRLTLGHLIDAGPAPVAHAAAQELANLFKVGACLHRDFSRVPALVRLTWAERFSQFDGPADFRDLGRLPAWQQVEFTLRREMQVDSDWLFGRIAAAQTEAVDLINDLIRVCLLLASRRPVDHRQRGRTHHAGVGRCIETPG